MIFPWEEMLKGECRKEREGIQLLRREEDFEARDWKGELSFLIHKTVASSVSAGNVHQTDLLSQVSGVVWGHVETGLKRS